MGVPERSVIWRPPFAANLRTSYSILCMCYMCVHLLYMIIIHTAYSVSEGSPFSQACDMPQSWKRTGLCEWGSSGRYYGWKASLSQFECNLRSSSVMCVYVFVSFRRWICVFIRSG